MATKKQTLEQAAQGKGCLGKAADDEPVFVLRAQDMLAPIAIQHWANLAKSLDLDSEMIQDARSISYQMHEWSKRKLPG